MVPAGSSRHNCDERLSLVGCECPANDRASPDCLEFAQTPHCCRRRGPGRGLNSSAYFADMHDIDLIGFVAPQLRPSEVADLSETDDAHSRVW
jgi:hypothetical protein